MEENNQTAYSEANQNINNQVTNSSENNSEKKRYIATN